MLQAYPPFQSKRRIRFFEVRIDPIAIETSQLVRDSENAGALVHRAD